MQSRKETLHANAYFAFPRRADGSGIRTARLPAPDRFGTNQSGDRWRIRVRQFCRMDAFDDDIISSSPKLHRSQVSSHPQRQRCRCVRLLTDIGEATLKQTLSTTPGQAYTFDFWAAAGFSSLAAPFDIYWDGAKIDALSLPNPIYDNNFYHFSYSVTATTANTEIKFDTSMVNYSAVSLDDVSVIANINSSPVPEPGTLAFLIGSGLGLGLLRLRRRK